MSEQPDLRAALERLTTAHDFAAPGLEARTIQGRRDIVEPLYRAVIQARINTARTIAAEYDREQADSR